MHLKPDPITPADFPRDYGVGVVSGVQPKLLVRKRGDTYVHGLTAEERYARYDNCVDLVNQLYDYCRRKLTERPEWAAQELLETVRASVTARADWDFSAGEINWMTEKLSIRMGCSPPAGK
jgi:hypothetical protein